MYRSVLYISSPSNLLFRLQIILFSKSYLHNIFLVISYITIPLATVLTIKLRIKDQVDYFIVFSV